VIGWDTETALIAPGLLAPPMACLSFSDGERSELVHYRDAYPYVRWLLEQTACTANGPYDLGVVGAQYPDLQELIFDALTHGRVKDVQTAQKLIDIAEGEYRWVFRNVNGVNTKLFYSLSDLHARYFGSRLEKDEWRLQYGGLREVYPLSAWPLGAQKYPKDDAIATARVRWAQERFVGRLPASEYLVDEDAQVRAHFALHLMACWGMKTRRPAVEELIAKIDSEIQLLAQPLMQSGLVKPDGKRFEKLAKERMFAVLGENCTLTKTGKEKVKKEGWTKEQAVAAGYISVDDDSASTSGDLALQAYARYGQMQLMRTKAMGLIIDSPIQTKFEILVETGRTSSYESDDNSNSKALQNLPRYWDEMPKDLAEFFKHPIPKKGEPKHPGLRGCFFPRDGWVYIDADAGQAELVSLSQICFAAFGFSVMGEAINNKIDVHLSFASDLLSMPYEEALKVKKRHDVDEHRQIGKTFNFSAPGGGGPDSLKDYARKTYGVTLTREQCIQFKKDWLRKWPEMKLYFKMIDALLQSNGSLDRFKNLRGYIQQYRSMRWRGGVAYTEACNCLDDQTEALTQRGWVKGFDLIPGDKLLTKNAETGEMSWQVASRIQKYPNYYGPLTEFKTKSFSAVTTPNHRWLVNTKRGDVLCKTTEEIGDNGDYRIHRSGNYVGPTCSAYTDDFVELVGWVLTDGSLREDVNRFVIYQSQRANPEKVTKIDSLFNRLGIKHRRVMMDDEGVRWSVSGSNPLVHLLKQLFPGRLLTVGFLLQLTKKQLELLWTTMMLGDGTCQGNPTLTRDGHQQHFTTASEQGADVFQHLCTLIGFASKKEWLDMSSYTPKPSAKMRNIPKCNGVWSVAVLRRETVQVVNLNKIYGKSKTQTTQRIDYVGHARMWCPVVPNTYFVARRNGTVYVTGNTLFQGLTADAMKAACFEVAKACYIIKSSPLYGCRPVMFAHDEIIAESPEAQAPYAAEELSRIIVDVYQRYTPNVRITAEGHIMRQWNKSAEPVRDPKSGLLVPWEDRKLYLPEAV